MEIKVESVPDFDSEHFLTWTGSSIPRNGL